MWASRDYWIHPRHRYVTSFPEDEDRRILDRLGARQVACSSAYVEVESRAASPPNDGANSHRIWSQVHIVSFAPARFDLNILAA
jgi:hypothetical protein